MSNEDEKTTPEIKGIKKINVARASGIMVAGTMVSRILGFARAALLIALIGSIGANDAFQAANNLPNIIFNLLASSILSAVLVPQIVRALQRKNSDEFINRLLTLFTTALLVLTLICVALAPVFITLFAAKLDPGWKQLAITFSYWSLPQIFFYGLYSLWGQFLNAKGSFGPYMWAPVVNNVVGISGIIVFWRVLGTETDWAGDPSVWTGEPIMLLAGISTLGIIVQALILLIPLRRTGFKMRLVWGIRGYGLGEVSRTAMWAFFTLCVNQVGFLAISNIAAAANGYAARHGVTIATTTAYSTAYTVFMIPQSIIVISVITALFTSMSAMVAVGQIGRLRNQFLITQQGVSLITVLCAALMLVLALPIMQFIMPTTPSASVRNFAQVLAVMALGIPFLGFCDLTQRLVLAFADARSLFFVQIPMTICTLIFCGITVLFLPAKYWVMGAAAGEQLSYLVGAGLTLWHLHNKHLPLKFTSQLWRSLWTILLSSLGAGCAGWLLLHYWGPFAGGDEDPSLIHMTGAFARLIVVTALMTIIYLGLLLVWRSPALAILAVPTWKKIRPGKALPRLLTYEKEILATPDNQTVDDEVAAGGLKSGKDIPYPVHAEDENSVETVPPKADEESLSPYAGELSKEDEDQVASQHPESQVVTASYNADGYVNLQPGTTLSFPNQDSFQALTLGQRLAGDFLPEKDAWTVTAENGENAELLVFQGQREKTREYYQRLRQLNAIGLQEFIWSCVNPVEAVLLRATPAHPLSEIVSSGMPPQVIHSLISQVSAALAQVHEVDLAHGAISPAHVLVSPMGKVIIRLDVADQNAPAQLQRAQIKDGQNVLELLYFLCTGKSDQFARAKTDEKLLPPSSFHHGIDIDLDAVALAGAAMPSPRLCQAIAQQLGTADLLVVQKWLSEKSSMAETSESLDSKSVTDSKETSSAFSRAQKPTSDENSDGIDKPFDNNSDHRPNSDKDDSESRKESGNESKETIGASDIEDEVQEKSKLAAKRLAMAVSPSQRPIKPVLPPGAKIPGHNDLPYEEAARTQAIPLAEMQKMNLDPQEEKAGSDAWVPQAVSAEQARAGRVTAPNFLNRLATNSASSAGQIPTVPDWASGAKPLDKLTDTKVKTAPDSWSTKKKFSKNPEKAAKQKAKLAQKISKDAERAAKRRQREQLRDQRRKQKMTELSPRDLEPVNATRLVIRSSFAGMGILLLVSVLVLILWPNHTPPVAKPAPSQTQTIEKSPQPEDTYPPAEIAGVASIDAEGNDTEHPELADKMIDGNEETYWLSRYFADPKLGDRNGFGVVVTFKAQTKISQIKLKTNASGGKIEVRSLPKSGLPRDGKILATGSFADTVTIKLKPRANAHALILWFPELPVDKVGNNRANISEISVS
ncbi:murein biosynthesis integral membrane protein MurJ [Varibaculum vaginae]|uniref:murein biosynthesis integral membrane protein MurJ n=1 Tax=Varibaculum vaginae TaxID=2364797 RepID=UPI000F07BC62|nr:murein biosynthesis integral membrane protein MurJ [Varibaculum vaginae]